MFMTGDRTPVIKGWIYKLWAVLQQHEQSGKEKKQFCPINVRAKLRKNDNSKFSNLEIQPFNMNHVLQF